MSATAPFWLSRYLPGSGDTPDTGQSWVEQLDATTAAVEAAETERKLQEERLREAAHSGRPLSQRPGARRMRELRIRRQLQAEAASRSCVQG
jgi:hypothetical protein